MRIDNAQFRIDAQAGRTWIDRLSGPIGDLAAASQYPLRLSIVGFRDSRATVEVTTVETGEDSIWRDALSRVEFLQPRRRTAAIDPFCVAQIVPTGIRCEFGGYAGDACPATNLLAAAADFVVTHPNAVNASDINEMAANVLYVEGKSLDDFLLGYIGLLPSVSNRVGTFIDPTGLVYLDDVENTLNAARAVKGIDCSLYTVLEKEIGVRIAWTESGCAVGLVAHPEAILDAVKLLLDEGADAVGGVSVIHGVTTTMFQDHLDGLIPNPSGGVEAIITHLISKVFRIPAAHAPLPYYQDRKGKDTRNPRAAAEFISTPHYFCVLKGLARAPRLVPIDAPDCASPRLLTVNQIGAVVVPASSLGGIPVLAAEFNHIPVIAVRENRTILDVTKEPMRLPDVIEVNSYLEAAGVVLALRQGISIESLRRPIPAARRIVRDAAASLPDSGVAAGGAS
ncbi:MAG: DUF3326 domain-containing protein [Bryobacterales bacterium]|nr:DUF3326 domain-containing protein [Bryobacterales bacterium]